MNQKFKVYNENVSIVEVDVTEGMSREEIEDAICDKYYGGDVVSSEEIPDITDIEDADGNILVENGNSVPSPYFTPTRARQLLSAVCDYVAISSNTPEQLSILTDIGFTKEELVELGYSEEDIDECYEEKENEEELEQ